MTAENHQEKVIQTSRKSSTLNLVTHVQVDVTQVQNSANVPSNLKSENQEVGSTTSNPAYVTKKQGVIQSTSSRKPVGIMKEQEKSTSSRNSDSTVASETKTSPMNSKKLLMFNKSRLDSVDEAENWHFMMYFIVTATIIISAYVAFHNRRKIIGLLVEGRSGSRRSNLRYSRLKSALNVDELR